MRDDNERYDYVPAARDGDGDGDDPAVELSARRTGMSFQRTRMSTDRTLMSVMRTSISLISFGFTIAQFFERMHSARVLPGGNGASRHFGIAMVGLGVVMLLLGIAYHLHYMHTLRREREAMARAGLIHGETPYPVSLTLLVSVALLAIGIFAIASLIGRVGPFG